MRTVTRTVNLAIHIEIPVVSEGLEVTVDPDMDKMDDIADLVDKIAELEGVSVSFVVQDSEVNE